MSRARTRVAATLAAMLLFGALAQDVVIPGPSHASGRDKGRVISEGPVFEAQQGYGMACDTGGDGFGAHH